MASKIPKDDTQAYAAQGADPHGQAALCLVESLIHGLIKSDAISIEGAVEVVDAAAEVQADIDADAGFPVITQNSVALLEAISSSLSRDIPCT